MGNAYLTMLDTVSCKLDLQKGSVCASDTNGKLTRTVG